MYSFHSSSFCSSEKRRVKGIHFISLYPFEQGGCGGGGHSFHLGAFIFRGDWVEVVGIHLIELLYLERGGCEGV